MATFLFHAPCPRCGSRDNLAVYDDGSHWCFGCSFYKPPERTISNSQKEEDNKNVTVDSSLSFSDNIPLRAMTWLKKYGITDEEIKKHEIQWCDSKHSLVLGRQFRYFGGNPDHPKAVTIPGRNGWDYYFNRPNPVLVLVEDFISAIKVGRCCGSFCLFGSHVDLPLLAYKWGQEGLLGKVGVWLDPDKQREGLKAVLRGLSVGLNARLVRSTKDPKDYSTIEISEILQASDLSEE